MSGFLMFEVLSQPIVPGIPNVPYVQQGTFVQIANTTNSAAVVSLIYYAGPNFVASSGAVTLFANYIDNNGQVTQVPAQTFIAQRGFVNVSIPSLATYIFGVQYVIVPGQSNNLLGATPQDGLATRGFIFLQSAANALVPPLGTIRQVFTNFNTGGGVQDVSEAAYPVPFTPYPAAQLFEG
ncbi:MAG TPA: hypothetical protein PLY97_01475 [Acidocella sp.]|nr:hypothetical protein [Acidocella sp.]